MFRSPFPDVRIPEVPLHKLLLERMERFTDNVAVVDAASGKEYTFGRILDNTRNVASGLSKRGLRKGDVVAFCTPNLPEFSTMFLAVISNGATVALINPLYTHYEIAHHLRDSGASWVFTSKDILPKVRLACEKHEGIKVQNTITLEPTGRCASFMDLVMDNGDHYPSNVNIEPRDDVAALLYSSGTTGLPKGVMLTHYNFVAQFQQFTGVGVGGIFRPNAPQVILGILPFFHVYGVVSLNLMALHQGNMLIVMQRFQPAVFLRAIEKYKVTHLPLVPAVARFLVKSDLTAQYDISSLKTIGSGAAPLDTTIEKGLKEKLGITHIHNGYGMTELTCSVSSSGTRPRKMGSVGFLRPNQEAKIVDPTTGKLCGPSEKGELWIRGPNVMKGYNNNPEATKQVLDKDGFIHSGDIGYRDEEGWIFIVDRIKELIKCKGFQVSPAELEAVILRNPGVADVGVVGVKDDRAGEVPRAYVVKKPGALLTEGSLDAFFTERVAEFKRLAGGIVFVHEIPRSPQGKIVRRKLVELFGNKSKL